MAPIGNSILLKRRFLRKFLLGVKRCNAVSKSMSLNQRKEVIKLSSNVAMASSREGSKWSRALISTISSEATDKFIVTSILGDDQCKILAKSANTNIRLVKSSRIIKSCKVYGRKARKSLLSKRSPAFTMAKNLQEKRKMLRCIVPGGESMDELCLLEETADYIVSLRAQVDVMKHLAILFGIAS